MTPIFVTQSTLGQWFGLTPVAVGKVLANHGLKNRFGATEKALLDGFAREARTKTGITFFVWNAEKVSVIIDEVLGNTTPTPYIDALVGQVGEALVEAERQRATGNDFFADLILEAAFQDIPSGLVGLIRERLPHQTTPS